MAKTYDVAVLGGGPAAMLAAAELAAADLNVAVVVPPDSDTDCPLADWGPKDLLRAGSLAKAAVQKAGGEPFSRVVYHDAELARQAEHKYRTPAGVLVQTSALIAALRSAAEKAGAKVRSTSTRPAIRLDEDEVCILGATQTHARLLLIVHSRPSDVISELALPVRTVPQSALTVAGLDIPLSGGQGKQLAGALHVVETPERTELGMFFAVNNLLHIRVISDSAASGTRAAELSALVSGLQRVEVLPSDLPLGRAKGAVWHPPAGVALELESHVAKRCILAGTAGGFAASVTGQTLGPSVASASLAAQVAHKALRAKNVQDSLMQFKSIWRKKLAPSLRPPNTSLQMLLPLLFVNKNVVPKFTRALLYGDNV